MSGPYDDIIDLPHPTSEKGAGPISRSPARSSEDGSAHKIVLTDGRRIPIDDVLEVE